MFPFLFIIISELNHTTNAADTVERQKDRKTEKTLLLNITWGLSFHTSQLYLYYTLQIHEAENKYALIQHIHSKTQNTNLDSVKSQQVRVCQYIRA